MVDGYADAEELTGTSVLKQLLKILVLMTRFQKVKTQLFTGSIEGLVCLSEPLKVGGYARPHLLRLARVGIVGGHSRNTLSSWLEPPTPAHPVPWAYKFVCTKNTVALS